jgi:hypothetical protein
MMEGLEGYKALYDGILGNEVAIGVRGIRYYRRIECLIC